MPVKNNTMLAGSGTTAGSPGRSREPVRGIRAAFGIKPKLRELFKLNPVVVVPMDVLSVGTG